MKTYLVGGAVRDLLMSLEPKDRDYVVVGATEQQMLDDGFVRVGASFPVFLKDGAEYALARTERKNGVGYKGFEMVFDPTVTLEDDLIRRDLTINSMAIDLDTGVLIDPYGGQHDLAQGVLRHTSEAFAEDPVRVLRTARFAARYGFKIADDTLELMTKIAPELEHVPQERIWAEFEKGLMEQFPSKMIVALATCMAFETPAMAAYCGATRVVDVDGDLRDVPLVSRFALIATEFTDDDYEECKIPTHVSRVSKAFNVYRQRLRRYNHLSPVDRLDVLKSMRAIQDSGHLTDVLEAATVWYGHQQMTASLLQINKDLKTLRQVNLTHAPQLALAAGMLVKNYVQHLQLNALSK